ncbi:MAG: LPXTG cell wall anchor domain-containing protein [Firmicutes bacterium]|nr:LPXTG cell wall anchor domain-containing protein [Bacillota bacterium]
MPRTGGELMLLPVALAGAGAASFGLFLRRRR